MKKLVSTLATVTALTASLSAAPVFARGQANQIPEASAVTTLRDFNFLENFDLSGEPELPQNPVGLAVTPKGNALIGMLFTGEILEVTPEGKTSLYAKLDFNPFPEANDPNDECPPRPDFGFPQDRTAFMTGFALHNNGDLYVSLPTCVPETQGIWRVSRGGRNTELFATLPVSQLPKGLALTNGRFPLYVTDLHDFRPESSREACRTALETDDPNDDCTLKIWRIDRNGNATDWVESSLLSGNPDSPLDHPHGVNGVVVDKRGKNVYVTVTDYGRVFRIPINRDGSAGELDLFFEEENPPLNPEDRELFGMDGITIGPDGNFYVVIVRTDQLIAISPDGSSYTEIVYEHPLDGPTQLAFAKGRRGRYSNSLPPLYITSGSGRRVLFFNLANEFGGQGGLIGGVLQLIEQGVITQEEAIGLVPRPSLVKVLLETEKDDDRRGR